MLMIAKMVTKLADAGYCRARRSSQHARACGGLAAGCRFLVVVSFGSGMAILAMTSHGQDARATANDATTRFLPRQLAGPASAIIQFLSPRSSPSAITAARGLPGEVASN